jgi:hypothetical protein
MRDVSAPLRLPYVAMLLHTTTPSRRYRLRTTPRLTTEKFNMEEALREAVVEQWGGGAATGGPEEDNARRYAGRVTRPKH